MQSVIQHTGQPNDGVLYLHVYAGSSESSFVFYEDDGTTYNYTHGEYHKRLIRYNPLKKEITLSPAEGSFTSRYRQVKFILHGMGKVQKFITSQGQPVNYTVGDKNTYEIVVPYGKENISLSWK